MHFACGRRVHRTVTSGAKYRCHKFLGGSLVVVQNIRVVHSQNLSVSDHKSEEFYFILPERVPIVHSQVCTEAIMGVGLKVVERH